MGRGAGEAEQGAVVHWLLLPAMPERRGPTMRGCIHQTCIHQPPSRPATAGDSFVSVQQRGAAGRAACRAAAASLLPCRPRTHPPLALVPVRSDTSVDRLTAELRDFVGMVVAW